jgi:hypothetical protein
MSKGKPATEIVSLKFVMVPSFHEPHIVGSWIYRFSAECVADVVSRTLTSEAPSYTTIMELDRKVREFPPIDSADSTTSTNDSSDFALSMQRLSASHAREAGEFLPEYHHYHTLTTRARIPLSVLLHIHRNFFAQAIIEHPTNPLKSTYTPSFLATYRSSSSILKTVKEMFIIWPESCTRYWMIWTFAFSAAVGFPIIRMKLYADAN